MKPTLKHQQQNLRLLRLYPCARVNFFAPAAPTSDQYRRKDLGALAHAGMIRRYNPDGSCTPAAKWEGTEDAHKYRKPYPNWHRIYSLLDRERLHWHDVKVADVSLSIIADAQTHGVPYKLRDELPPRAIKVTQPATGTVIADDLIELNGVSLFTEFYTFSENIRDQAQKWDRKTLERGVLQQAHILDEKLCPANSKFLNVFDSEARMQHVMTLQDKLDIDSRSILYTFVTYDPYFPPHPFDLFTRPLLRVGYTPTSIMEIVHGQSKSEKVA